MAKFTKRSKTNNEIPTAALPDIIFMLLFFFMVTTVLRETTIMVKQELPKSTQLSKLERKSLISYLYVGQPTNTTSFGTEPKIQVNDVFIEVKDIIRFVNQEKDKLSEVERDQITMAMKVDVEAKMGIISDIQEQLREANARKVLYSSTRRVD